MSQKFGLFTPYTLKFHADYFNESSNNFLKRSLILFDELTYMSPRIKDKNFLEKLIVDKNPDIVKQILSNFKPIEEFVDDDFISEISFTVKPESNMWYGPNSKFFLKFIKDHIREKFGFDPDNYKSRNEFEILDYYVTALSADVNFLFQISRKIPEVSALYTELHRDAFFATYNEKSAPPERLLKSIASINYFDFGKLSWKQILELKQSQFVNDFRLKFDEWIEDYEQIGNIESIEKKIDQYIKESNFKFLSENRPLTRLNILSSILENIPTPFPNPLAVYKTVSQTLDNFQTEKDYGWLFFIQESFHKSQNSA